jgi:hypothetical protein
MVILLWVLPVKDLIEWMRFNSVVFIDQSGIQSVEAMGSTFLMLQLGQDEYKWSNIKHVLDWLKLYVTFMGLFLVFF